MHQQPYNLVENPDGEQRWRQRKSSFVPPSDCFDASRAEVALVSEADGRSFVTQHHYSKAWVAARFRVGLFQKRPFEPSKLVGVAVFGVGMQPLSLKKYLGLDGTNGIELSRFVLLDEVKFNGETWMLARAFKLLREHIPGVRGVLAYSDPLPYTNGAGQVTKVGHAGTIYRAFNANYGGRSLPRTIRLSPQGLVVSDRSLGKIRQGHSGSSYAYEDLLELGAPPRRPDEEASDYVRRVLAEGPFRRVKHPGKHVFTWSLKAA